MVHDKSVNLCCKFNIVRLWQHLIVGTNNIEVHADMYSTP